MRNIESIRNGLKNSRKEALSRMISIRENLRKDLKNLRKGLKDSSFIKIFDIGKAYSVLLPMPKGSRDIRTNFTFDPIFKELDSLLKGLLT